MADKKSFSFKTVLVLGSGPIVIGQACEFDYSGTQSCLALKEEGLRVVLLNSNPATIMTDPEIADRTYIEPMDPLTVVEIIRREGVDAILPTMGGQTGLNLVAALAKIPGALDGVQVIGANLKSIHLAEDRRAFREVLASLGLDSPRSSVVRSIEELEVFASEVGYPFILRPSFTMGGTGQSFVFSSGELIAKGRLALTESPIGEALAEESVLGWKEFELELMRDRLDNAIVVCSIENLDPMGVHTGDSVTVAPQQTLTDREYQAMRHDALTLIRRIGVETGGCNVQFAVDPKSGRRIVIEMNPRVSRSSALASKATGFPIAFVATKLALGYALSEVDNQIVGGGTKACFEPPLDYVAVKIPRFHFEKFPGTKDELLPQMQSVGEVLALGATFGEAFHKALLSLERKWPQFAPVDAHGDPADQLSAWHAHSSDLLERAHSLRPYAIWDALACGVDELHLCRITGIDRFFIHNLRRYQKLTSLKARATALPVGVGSEPRYDFVDSCAAEMKAKTPYFYSSRLPLGETNQDVRRGPLLAPGKRGRVVILGSGPNRIGQGVEFDYCCVHASRVLRELGFETVMLNCNPETVSTDPRSSDRLYLEPLTADSVHAVLKRELSPLRLEGREAFVLLQTGGQTPLKLAEQIAEWGYQILGTSPNSIDLCEDRAKFAALLRDHQIPYPEFVEATSLDETLEAGRRLGFPLLMRPSFVLGGQAMRVCVSEKDLVSGFSEAKEVSGVHPLYIDRFLADAVEFDVDGICDGERAWVAGVMEHVEEAGVHSGDSSCVIPPFRLPAAKIDEMAGLAKRIAVASGAKGFFNIQMVVLGDQVYVLEANPRASRTIPFLAKATGYPLLDWGIRAALGEKVQDLIVEAKIPGNYRLPSHGYAVKTPVFPFNKFREFDPVLGPEMRSTGEVMGIDATAGAAFAKAFLAAGVPLPVSGKVLVSVRDQDKPKVLSVARVFQLLGFELLGTPGTAVYLNRAGLVCESVAKIGQAPLGLDLLRVLEDHGVTLIINTTSSVTSLRDGMNIRKAAIRNRIPLLSTISAAEMASMAIETLKYKGIRPVALQDFVAQARN